MFTTQSVDEVFFEVFIGDHEGFLDYLKELKRLHTCWLSSGETTKRRQQLGVKVTRYVVYMML